MTAPEAEEWCKAIEQEFHTMEEKGIWEKVDEVLNKKILGKPRKRKDHFSNPWGSKN